MLLPLNTYKIFAFPFYRKKVEKHTNVSEHKEHEMLMHLKNQRLNKTQNRNKNDEVKKPKLFSLKTQSKFDPTNICIFIGSSKVLCVSVFENFHERQFPSSAIELEMR